MKNYSAKRFNRASAKETSVFKRESSVEGGFFTPPIHQPFFVPQPTIQRKCEACEKEEKKLQKKESTTATQAVPNAVVLPSGGGSPLPAKTARFFSARMGYDFSGVEVYTGHEAAASAKQLHAQAYTIGNRIIFNEGRFDTQTESGKKLLAHELAHVRQQDSQRLFKKEEEQDCNETLDLEGYTDAVYNKGAGTAIGEKKKPAKGCDDCDDSCIQATGFVKVPYKVATTVSLPTVPDDLRPCQQQRVSGALKNKLAPHEQKHVAAFKTFEGSPLLPIKYKGCESGYDSYLEGLAETEFERRKS
ncbi:MAG: DUF4157 domain-containing protein, partial [Chitinophagaceae bacterium]